ncbi:MAG: very short patch repair endonuclease [Devosia sp.]|nr:very short patch repair endonuclease [Devosia sp.]
MDMFTPERRSQIMSSIRSKDTKPELVVRRILFAMGKRYRLHRKDLPGRPDIVFGPLRRIVMVHGCFWHGHTCRRGHRPKSNNGYWNLKIERNIERDRERMRQLQELGWSTLVVWECETQEPDVLGHRLARFLSGDDAV